MRLPFSPGANQTAAGLREQADTLAEALPPLVAEAERIANTVAQGVHGRRRTGMGESFWQFRRFREGDTAASVDWRHSARSRHLFVRETEAEAAESVWIWRDGSPSMDYASELALSTKKDRATVLALALTSLLIQGGESVAALGSGLPPSGGRAAHRRIAHSLLDAPDTNATATGLESLPPPQHLPRYAQIVLISDFLSPVEDIVARIKGYASDGIRGHLIQVLDPAEEDLPFTGRTEFEGVEENLRLMIGRAEGLRKAYHARLALHRDRIMEAAQRINFTFATHRTDRAPHTALLALYGALSGAIDARKPPRPGA
ncbi:MAG: DUF58 domain-containing protein [Parvibaculum sp.]|uniref:DUF58 domain-containing protein n=1 Tax=Parvibaculum sp. TaxID=2024848 RepID=UPI0025E588FE|nr:DUF58 domain-containing protein [Parvibaculum sp.]MCE9649497.1 DUF58 domain-containing protein [Parvibaculum sp.]